jgi:farnesyl-diphosphate farnesyltransferase
MSLAVWCRKFTMQCGAGHYKQLMAQFNIVTEVFLSLEEQYQEVIADITKRMGAGMADFIQQEVRMNCGSVLVTA